VQPSERVSPFVPPESCSSLSSCRAAAISRKMTYGRISAWRLADKMGQGGSYLAERPDRICLRRCPADLMYHITEGQGITARVAVPPLLSRIHQALQRLRTIDFPEQLCSGSTSQR